MLDFLHGVFVKMRECERMLAFALKIPVIYFNTEKVEIEEIVKSIK